jgi:hypothetical protein
MQQEMIGEIEAARPKFLVFVDIPTSWLRRTSSDMLIFDWYARYREHYDLVGIIDIFVNGPNGIQLGKPSDELFEDQKLVVVMPADDAAKTLRITYDEVMAQPPVDW